MDSDIDLNELTSTVPRPGLINCLSSCSFSTVHYSSPMFLSMLCIDGIRQVRMSSKQSSSSKIPMSTSVPTSTSTTIQSPGLLQGELHAYARPELLISVYGNHVHINDLTCLQSTKIYPRLHFQARSLSACINKSNNHQLRLVVGGYDGAYYLNTTTNTLKVLPGSQGFPVCVVRAHSHGIGVALIDSRVAIWNDVNSPPVTLVPTLLSTLAGDRVSDISFTSSVVIIAYWSGLVVVYDRMTCQNNGHVTTRISPLFQVYTTHGKATPEHLFCNRGATMIVHYDDDNDNDEVVSVIDGDGCIVFIALTDSTCVRREITSRIWIKGACAVHKHNIWTLVLWVINQGVTQLIEVDWPSKKEIQVARRVVAELERRRKAEASTTQDVIKE